ncbi:GntR family transcriptional regulator [Amycolatopsis mediterranei S699]|uniref:GntR family transcriptional regulator n=2 Tax=Amycolatopsis mediterranei TaxID=33910 RepID=A0A0H3D4S9_AMYMU|nr:GntR family transcriptional regulator [Amycolatopsis mediterranei]ADJ45178.1 GntR family transcriptional regulator [Amycolatopsis mediterranei U32]AEK41937.1 GntR family transcriptional regulator [Amycolatopsis mediterranei S699]AFO76889.1 GntR family transcriptional regulator [Amycolatopsis mediterranei S699]AGT84017.1 GntR family transcriptional regulator [Amycolatopsis mediterranei RB]KDO08653.1 GntR family transcriptional regulator [Amycolatopsis mediterranei]
MSASLVPARRRGLADEVADRVRDAIFDGGYAPGGQLREVELAEALGVSRGPVREALLKLEREGLVRSEWHRGATVTTLSAEDVAELDSLRAALEHLAVELVVERAGEDALAAIDAVVRRMDRAADEHEMVRCDLEFHDAVYAAAGHRRLLEAWCAIRSQVHLFLLTRIGVATDGYLAGIPAEHRELAAALRARDRETVLALFAEHRRQAFEILSGRTD